MEKLPVGVAVAAPEVSRDNVIDLWQVPVAEVEVQASRPGLEDAGRQARVVILPPLPRLDVREQRCVRCHLYYIAIALKTSHERSL